MNILVTGANGQLGNEMRLIASQLKTQNPALTTQDSPLNFLFTDVCEASEEAKAMLRSMGGDNVDTSTTILDITHLESISQLVTQNSIHACINCAAWTNVDGAEDPEKYALVEKLNATAPENLAKAMKEVGGWLVQISTDYVFGKEPYNTPCKEDQTGTPTGVYGATKLLGEQKIIEVMSGESCVMSDTQNSKPKTQNSGGYIIIRTAWLYSEFGKNFCKTMLNLTATKPQLKVVFDQCGTPTYAYDLASVIVTILDKVNASTFKGEFEGVYHYSNEGVCSWYDFTQMIQKIALKVGYYESLPKQGDLEGLCDIQPCYSSEYPSPVKRPSYSVLDKKTFKDTFGIKVPYWVDSLEECINNIKNN